MISNFDEDEALLLLNDITITDDELSDFELSDIEKDSMCKNIINKVKTKKSNKKKLALAASLALILCASIPLSNRDAFGSMISRLVNIPDVGNVRVVNNGLSLKKSEIQNDVTLNTMYIDNKKIIITLTIKSPHNYYYSNYFIKDEHGNTYKLDVVDSSAQSDINITTYKAEYDGDVKSANKYFLSVMGNKAEFSLTSSDFTNVEANHTFYSATNGITTLNVTSVSRDKDILKVAYYVNDINKNSSTIPSFNIGTFKEVEYAEKKGYKYLYNSTVDNPIFKLYDESGNSDFGHSSQSHLTFENESLFNLKKLKGKKLKLTLPSVVYTIGYFTPSNGINIDLPVPESGKLLLNKAGDYNGFKYKIIGIERLSKNTIALDYNFINDPSSKLQIFDMSFNSTTVYSSDIETDPSGYLRSELTSRTPIGTTFNLNEISMSYASVGPFEINIDLDKVK
jgi:hypothetical protein